MTDINSCTSCGSGSAVKGCKNNGHCSSGNCNKLSTFDWLANVRNPVGVKPFDRVEVRFKNDRKGFFKNEELLPLKVGDIIAVEGNPGHDIGIVTLTGELARLQIKGKRVNLEREENNKKVYRIANQKDIDKWQEVRGKEYDVMVKTREIVRRIGLDMKICDVEYQGDGAKATFYYTAEGRVDFRELIKELAAAFRTRIEMRQIGYRQGAAKVGGIGSCGRELCCSTWLTDFRSVNTTAARYQQLSINPQKLAGQCGKLKCCLNYELDSYLEAIKTFPDISVKINTEKGWANCMKLDIFKQEVWYAYSDNYITWYKLDTQTANELIALNKKGKKAADLAEYVEKNTHAKEIVFESAEEDSLDRFDTKNNRKNNNRPNQGRQNQRPQNNNQRPNNNQRRPNANNQQTGENTSNEPNAVNQNNRRNPNSNRPQNKPRPNNPNKNNPPKENKTEDSALKNSELPKDATPQNSTPKTNKNRGKFQNRKKNKPNNPDQQ